MNYLVVGSIILFGLMVVYLLWITTQDSFNIVIPTEDYLVDKFEDKLKQENKKFKYVPKNKFKDMSECFSQVNTYFSRELLLILNN